MCLAIAYMYLFIAYQEYNNLAREQSYEIDNDLKFSNFEFISVKITVLIYK